MRTEQWTEEPLVRHVGKDKQEQYYVYVLEAVVIFEKGITLPLMNEFLNNEEYREVSTNKQPLACHMSCCPWDTSEHIFSLRLPVSLGAMKPIIYFHCCENYVYII
ncbi:hypothetical protein [Desulfosporosinus metallidurans]|uniref:hypothetical protein n=1 Tax=Desulfosporosinus metallidurans TaxID=1888891 RepID=UPI00094D8138|nr:hypothetical protein [Desulfosporosinus metallidurans]